ncbi:MAG: hypothetical protein ACE37H_13895 [Phycisphaeraceae bacterium]
MALTLCALAGASFDCRAQSAPVEVTGGTFEVGFSIDAYNGYDGSVARDSGGTFLQDPDFFTTLSDTVGGSESDIQAPGSASASASNTFSMTTTQDIANDNYLTIVGSGSGTVSAEFANPATPFASTSAGGRIRSQSNLTFTVYEPVSFDISATLSGNPPNGRAEIQFGNLFVPAFVAKTNDGQFALNESGVLEPGDYALYYLVFASPDVTLNGGPATNTAGLDFQIHLGPAGFSSQWQNPAGGLFGTAENWDPPSTPGSNDALVFNLPSTGYVVEMDQNASVSSATVEQGTVSWRFNGNAGNTIDIANDLVVGTEPNIRGGLDVIGGTVSVVDVNIGTADNADALVTLREGAVLDPIGDVNVGGGANAEAQLFIIGGSTLKLDEGENLNITGPASEVTTDALSVGTTNVGGGSINVTQGAELLINGDLDILDSDLTISGADSVVKFGGSAQFTPGSRVRLDGGGRLQPVSFDDEDAAVLINTAGLSDEDAGVTIAGAGSRLRVGEQDLAIGTVNDAEVEVSTGGELTTLSDMVLGSLSGSSYGELILTGAGSNALAGSVFVFSSGATPSLFEVSNGGKASVFAGFEAADSEVAINGAGSELEIAEQFRITGGANAVLDIEDGGRMLVNTDLENPADEPFSLVFDSIDPSLLTSAEVVVGGATVSGAGSELRTIGHVFIGSQSDGLLTVADAGLFITLGDVYLGDAENDTKGFLVVDGTSNFLADSVIVGEDEGGEGQFLARNNAVPQVLSVLDVRDTGTVKVNPQSSILVGTFDHAEQARRDNYVVIGPNGLLTGSGSVEALADEAGGVNNLGGIVNGGSSPGTLTITGDFLQGEDGTLIIEIAGTDAGTTYDVLSITGDADIAGTVVFRFIDGYAPKAGDSFLFLQTQGSADLSNATLQIEGLEPGFEYVIDPEVPGGPYVLTALNDGVFIPEPATLSVLLIGPLAFARRRRCA